MSVPTISPLAAALRAQLSLDPEVILAGLDPVPLPSDKARRTQDAKPAAEPQPAKPAPPPAAQAVEIARQTAAGRQSGIAPLMADLEQAVRNEILPATVRAAAEKVLNLQTPIAAPVTPEIIKRAVARSGLFLEPRLAKASRASPPPPDLKSALLVLRQVIRAASPPLPTPASANPPAAGANPAAPVANQLPVQPSGAPPQAATTADAPTLPPASAPGVATTYAPPRGPALPQFDAPFQAAAAPAAAQPQAPVASTAVQQPTAGTAPPAPLPGAPASTPPGAPPVTAQFPSQTPVSLFQPQSPSAPIVPGQAALPADLPAGALPDLPAPLQRGQPLAAQTLPAAPIPADAQARQPSTASAQADRAAPAATPGESPPPPPVKGAPPQAQPAVQPQLAADADPAAVLRHLDRATSGAIARTELFQLASLPDVPRADGEMSIRPQSWLFEVPLATQQGPAVAQFEIEKDGSSGQAGREGAAWRTRFSVDVEPLGLIHALLVLAGGRTTVTLWAERTETLKRLRADQADLAGAIEAEVTVYPGRPTAPRPVPGRFLDASS